MREHHRRLVTWLTDQGATDIRLDPKHKHMHVHFRWQERSLRYVTAATLSDSKRGTVNAVSDLRHMLGLTEPVKRVGARRQHRGKTAVLKAAAPVLTTKSDWRETLPALWPRRGRPFLRRLVAGFARFAALSHPSPSEGEGHG